MSDDLEHLSDIELLKELEESALAERLKSSEEWKLLKTLAERVVERAVNELAIKTRPDDIVRITELKTVIRKHKYGIFKEIELLAEKGPFLYDTARKRDLEGME